MMYILVILHFAALEMIEHINIKSATHFSEFTYYFVFICVHLQPSEVSIMIKVFFMRV